MQEKLRFFQAVGRAVNSSLILEDIFESLGEVLYAYVPYREAIIIILDDSRNGVKTRVCLSAGGALDISGEHNAFAGADPLIDDLLRNPQPRRYQRQDDWPASGLLLEDALAALVVPLVNKGVVIGLIALSGDEPDGFPPAHEELLDDVSAQLAVAVENARLYWQTQAQAGREFLINQLTRSIRQSLDIDVILGTAVTELGKVMGVSRCFIRYFPPAGPGGDPVDEKSFHYRMPGVPPLPESPEARPEREVFRLRKDQSYNPFILNDVRDCLPDWIPPAWFEAGGIRSMAVIPILIRDTLAGVIVLHQCDACRVWVMEDIELLRAMAEHLGVALHQAQLFLALDQRSRELERTLEELQQAQLYLVQSEKMAMLGQFVAGIAHEVNTPLGTMVGNNATLTACLEKLKPFLLPGPMPDRTPGAPGSGPTGAEADPARLLAGMDSLLSLNRLAGSRIQEIVRNLRNFARLDESELKCVDLREGIESTILLLQSSLEPRVQLIRRYGPDVPPVQCYPGLLNQVFMNLLVNAGHAIGEAMADPAVPPDVPMTITITTFWDAASETVSVVIRDTGKGIAPENLAKVFDPGFTTKGVGVGTGLGLALCYRIVEKHGGRISVESAPNAGAAFTVRLPLRPH
jgi:signal transduction histidine kinase